MKIKKINIKNTVLFYIIKATIASLTIYGAWINNFDYKYILLLLVEFFIFFEDFQLIEICDLIKIKKTLNRQADLLQTKLAKVSIMSILNAGGMFNNMTLNRVKEHIKERDELISYFDDKKIFKDTLEEFNRNLLFNFVGRAEIDFNQHIVRGNQEAESKNDRSIVRAKEFIEKNKPNASNDYQREIINTMLNLISDIENN